MVAKRVKCQLCGKSVLLDDVAFARVVVDKVAKTRRRVCPECATEISGRIHVTTVVGKHVLVWTMGRAMAVVYPPCWE